MPPCLRIPCKSNIMYFPYINSGQSFSLTRSHSQQVWNVNLVCSVCVCACVLWGDTTENRCELGTHKTVITTIRERYDNRDFVFRWLMCCARCATICFGWFGFGRRNWIASTRPIFTTSQAELNLPSNAGVHETSSARVVVARYGRHACQQFRP